MTPDTLAPWRRALVGACLIGVVFAATVTALLLVDAARLRSIDPVAQPTLMALKERLADTPADEALRAEIRQLDAALRGRIFAHQAQRRLAGWLLLLDAALILLALMASARLRPPPERAPDVAAAVRPWVPGPAVLGLGGGACLVALLLVLLGGLDDPLPAAAVVEAPPALVPGAPSPWPAFRGPGGRAVINGVTPPQRLSDETRLWTSPLPKPGFGSPVIAGDVIALVCGDADGVLLLGIDRHSGDLRWQVPLPDQPGDRFPAPDYAGWAASSPVSDGTVIAATAANGTVVGVSSEGRVLWMHQPGAPRLNYGYGSSLQIHEGLVFLQRDCDDSGEVIAYDLYDGSIRWRTVRDGEPSWASPVITDGKPPLLVLLGAPEVIAYAPASGVEVWRAAGPRGEIGPSPAAMAQRVVVCQDGSSLICLDAADGAERWRREDVDLPDIASPLLTGERIYTAQSWGLLQCFAVADGELLWQEYAVGPMQATPLLVGDQVYLLNDAGELIVIEDSADGYHEVARSALGEKSVTTPVIVGDTLYIRGETALHAFAERQP